jgi:hypothetical protein
MLSCVPDTSDQVHVKDKLPQPHVPLCQWRHDCEQAASLSYDERRREADETKQQRKRINRLLILFLMSTGFGKMLFFNGFPDSHAWR